jgi:chromosome segregation ATPase
VHELQNELHERSNEEFDRSFKHPNPNDRTRFTDIDTRKSDDLRRELQEMEDRLKMYKKEVEHWKQKYHTLENDRRRALDDLQNQYDESMRNQLTGMNGSYNSKMQDLAN